ncbi:Uncharacterized protein APZ42_012538 [Daphnia magna]|uniref:Uncharacterized protein n=1 Tax=Daphnia magna TaxID=35525 RepID=A0A0P5XPC0_9CRUS|nr:Uncharacterized protein APZ42_012538 [Daphnia magna]
MNDRSFHSLSHAGQARWCWEHTVSQSCLPFVHILCWLLFTQVVNNHFCVFRKAKDSIILSAACFI